MRSVVIGNDVGITATTSRDYLLFFFPPSRVRLHERLSFPHLRPREERRDPHLPVIALVSIPPQTSPTSSVKRRRLGGWRGCGSFVFFSTFIFFLFVY